jgi:CelD/BcsL family acetyltransferase involved in cellulose biosynthesis
MGTSLSEGAPFMSALRSADAPDIQRFTSPAGLNADLPDWGPATFRSRSATPMQSRAWIVACAESFATDGDLRITVIQDERGIAAIAPLVRRKSLPPVTELLGARELGEPSDFLFRDEEALRSLVQVLARERTPMVLHRIPAASQSVEVLQRSLRGRAITIARPGNNCPRISIPLGTADADQLLSSSLRSDLRRAQRKADAHGKVSVEVHAPRTAPEFLPLYEQALQVEAAGWKGRGGSAVSVNQAQRAFFSRYGVLASEAGVLRLAFLRFDGVVAAMQYAVEWNGAFWLLKVGYDETYAKCSPGQLLMLHTLRYACLQHLRSYEFLGSAESWTQRWTTAEHETLRMTVYPFGLAGMLAFGGDSLRALRRRGAARLEARRRSRAAAAGAPAGADASGA